MKVESKIILIGLFIFLFIVVITLHHQQVDEVEDIHTEPRETYNPPSSSGGSKSHISPEIDTPDEDAFIGTWGGDTSYGEAIIVVRPSGVLSISAGGMNSNGVWQVTGETLIVSAFYQTYEFEYVFSIDYTELTLLYDGGQWALVKV